MAKTYYTILTRAGRQKLALLAAQKRPLDLAEAAIGDGGGAEYDPKETQNALKGEKWRGPINHLARDPSNALQLIAEVVVPDEVGDFYVREIGLFDADGLLFAIGSLAETYKPTLPSGSTKQLTVRSTIATENAASVRLVIDPNVTLATRQWAEERLGDIVATLGSALVQGAQMDARQLDATTQLQADILRQANQAAWFDRRMANLEALPSLDGALVSLAATLVRQGAALQSIHEATDTLALDDRLRNNWAAAVENRLAMIEALPSSQHAIVAVCAVMVQLSREAFALTERVAGIESALALLKARFDLAFPSV